MTAQELLDALEARFTAIDARLGTAGAGEREALRADIVGFFRETEAAIEGLTGLKERIRGLVERYKALPPPEAPAPRAQPVVADLIGSTTYVERGWSAIASGDAKRAVKELERALELAPNDPNTETLLGWAQMLREQYDDALMTYYKVLMKDPNNPLARVNLGYICLKKGIFGEAIEHLSKAIRQESDRKAQMYAHLYMGLVYLEREMYEDARGFFKRTLELAPNMLEAWWETGRAFYREGRTDEAREAWRTGFQVNRFNLWGERCGKALAQLEAGQPVTA
ncbi:MAG TPA: tetratricopeptide repeat protein [Longimicrobium sp.]|nr:tetratricopeptide repeat protein [Longimicrobium sp.]